MTKTIRNKDGSLTIKVTQDELNRKVKEWNAKLKDYLSESYSFTLPLNGVKQILQVSAEQIIGYDFMVENCGVSSDDDLRVNVLKEVCKSLIQQLTDLGLDGNQITNDACQTAYERKSSYVKKDK